MKDREYVDLFIIEDIIDDIRGDLLKEIISLIIDY